MSNNVLYNPPIVIPVDVDPALRDATPLFTGYAIAVLSDIPNDNRGPGREQFMSIMQREERLFAEMVQIIASLSEYLLISNNASPNEIEAAIQQVVKPVVDGYYGLVIDRYAREFEQARTISQQQYDDRVVVQQKLQAMISEMDRFNGNGSGTRGRGTGFSSTGGGWGAGHRAQQNDIRKAADSVFTGDTRRGAATHDEDNFSAGGRVTRQVVKEPEPLQHKPNVWEGRQFLPMISGSTTYPLTLNPRKPWDWVVANNTGLMLQPACSSQWKLSYKAGHTVPWYDPQTAILMYMKKPSGEVVTQALTREIDMNYLDHEQDPELRLMAKEEALARDNRVPIAFQLVESIRPVPGKPLAELGPVNDGNHENVEVEVLSTPDTYELANNARALFDRNMLRLKVDEDPSKKKAYEFYADIYELTTLPNPNVKLLSEMSDQSDFCRLAALVTTALQGPDKELAEMVNTRMTEAVNHALAVNMGLAGWSIDSFHEDIVGCLNLITDHAGAQSNLVLSDSAVEIIGSTLSHFSAEEGHDGIYAALGLDDIVKDDESILIWRARTSMTRIPLSSHDLGLPVDARMIDQTNFPAFYSACEAILSRTPDHPVAFKNRYLALTDGKVYELTAGFYDRSALIVKRTDFVVAK